MSPNPEEPGHERFGLTHAICDADYQARQAEKGWPPTPARVRHTPDDPCCYCGQPSSGVYVREDPTVVHPGVA